VLPALLAGGAPNWVARSGGLAATLDLDMVNNRGWVQGRGLVLPANVLTTTRASQISSLLPTSASGASYLTFASGAPALVPGVGLQSYKGITNLLLNSTAPVTQTTASLGTGTYTLWVNGSGSATPSGATATITGAASATNGSPNTFTVTVAGTVTVTVSGSLNAFQLQSGLFGTALVITAGATVTSQTDMIVYPQNPLGAGNFTVLVSVGGIAVQTGGFPTLLSVNDGTGNNETQIYSAAGGPTVNGKEQTSSISRFDTTVASSISGGAGKVAMTLNGTAVRGASNGGNLTALGAWTAFADFTKMQIGTDNGGANNPLNGIFKRVTVFQSGMNDAQLLALTA
jgi:hypothetical protein